MVPVGLIRLEEVFYCQNDYTTQGHRQIQMKFIKLPMVFFTELEQKKNFFLICMETQKIPTSQSNLEKEKGRWRNWVP